MVDLESCYHALLGRPALAKFMGSCHISYLKMKLPGPQGVITIAGDYKKSLANPHGSVSFQPTKEMKKFQIDEQFPERTVTIVAGMDAK